MFQDQAELLDQLVYLLSPGDPIWNSGSLPEGITPETLINGHLSMLRNPDIAHVLYLR